MSFNHLINKLVLAYSKYYKHNFVEYLEEFSVINLYVDRFKVILGVFRLGDKERGVLEDRYTSMNAVAK